MRHSLTSGCIVALTLLSAGCASVPEVESRLQTLQFHPNMYVVQAGDTVQTIAHRYRLRPAELVALNPVLAQNIRPGQRINVRPGTQLAASTRAAATQPAMRNSNSTADSSWPVFDHERNQVPVIVGPAAPINQPVIISSTRPHPDKQATSTAVNSTASDSSNNAIAGTLPAYAEIAEIPAAARTNSHGLSNGNYPREEIIPDTLDYSVGKSDRALLGNSLQSMVGEWTWPTQGQVARGFAPDQIGGQGVDIAGVPGQDVRAAMDGTVVYSGRDLSGGGNLIIVRHTDNLMTTYSHAQNLYVAEDDVVSSGDPIASLGWNANRESVLRFEVRKNGNPLNPMDFLPIN